MKILHIFELNLQFSTRPKKQENLVLFLVHFYSVCCLRFHFPNPLQYQLISSLFPHIPNTISLISMPLRKNGTDL